ncbi:ribonuclease H-like domain-containing protein [Tanacetum coccineum]
MVGPSGSSDNIELSNNLDVELKSTYDKVDGSVIFNLLQKINVVKQGGSSVVDYYHRPFDALTKLPKCVCEVKCSCDASKELILHQQLMKLMQFLMSLDDCYQPIRSALFTMDPLPKVKDAYITVSREESHMGLPKSSSVSESKLNATSFAAKYFNKNRRLGHPADQVLSVLHNDLKISKSSFVHVCKICHMAKQKREPFPLSSHKSKTLGKLVHLDLWVPYRAAIFGFKRDVKFYETMFPFKMKSKESVDAECASETDHLTFFDNQIPQRPYDDGRATYVVDGSVPSSRHNITYTTLCQEEYTATQIDDQSSSEGNNFQNTSGKTLNENIFEQEDVQTPGLRSWPLYQLDVNNDFLYGDLVEDVYMCLPQGYDNVDKSKVCIFTKSLYGLKQASRQWNAKLTTALAKHCIEHSKFGYSLYTKQKGDIFISLLVYVDDIVIIGNDESRIKGFKEFLSTKYSLLVARPVDISLPENSVLCFEESENDKYLSDFTSYQKLAALRVLRYLKGSPHCGIQFDKKFDLKLKAFVDANWAKFPMNRKSITNFCYDNSLAIKKAANLMFHERTKHFKLDVHFVREKVMDCIIKTVTIDNNVQVADIFTKCLGVVQHNMFCRKLGLLDMFVGVMTCKEMEDSV